MAIGLAITVDDMRTADIAQVQEVERLSFATPWPSYAFEQEITGNRLARYVVARLGPRPDDRVVAFAGVWLMVDEAHITTFAVHPEFRRQGVGRRLMVRLLDLALELRATRLTLEVRSGNDPAQALYREFGFEVVGRRPHYYSDDGEDALVMSTPPLAEPGMRSVLARARSLVTDEAER
ncbi:MAG TPA: ribosomal protein S18-alanine N-acetyltransferase [Candidatus Limnocylindria bacterium]|nr:ribosomal protein S18-alanine N-acetyltransferase [Candidatus Limnocylindria bacterium]